MHKDYLLYVQISQVVFLKQYCYISTAQVFFRYHEALWNIRHLVALVDSRLSHSGALAPV